MLRSSDPCLVRQLLYPYLREGGWPPEKFGGFRNVFVLLTFSNQELQELPRVSSAAAEYH